MIIKTKVKSIFSLMKQQYVLTQQNTILQEKEKPDRSLIDWLTLKHVIFLQKHKDKQFFLDIIFLQKVSM